MNRTVILLVGNFLSAHTGSRSAGEELNIRLKQMGWKTITTSDKKTRLTRLFDMISCVFFRRNEYHIAYVEIYSGRAFLWAEIVVYLLHLLKKPCVLGLHGGRLVEFAEENKDRIKNLFAKAEHVTTPSRFLHRYFYDVYPNVIYIPNGVDAQKYVFRARISPRPEFIWVRAFHSIYQPLMAIRVFNQIKGIFPGARLTMIGPDKNDGSLLEVITAVEKARLMNIISIVGPVPKDDIPVWLDKADIFLNTTSYESFGVSVMEAASLGLPIVTTNVGEIPFLWTQGENAMLVSVNDESGMVKAIEDILTTPGLALHLSTHARNKAEQFDWAAILPQWDALFHEVTDGMD